MITFPNAKINIGLHVVSKRPDGYHNLETIFYPVQLSDALEMVEAKETKLSFSGIKIDGQPEKNLVYKAWELLRTDFDIPPVHFHLHKAVPFGAGLGGGSSDAAFALKMMNDYFSLNLANKQLANYASQIGADCTFFIYNKPVFAEGIGNQFSTVNIDLSDYKIVIIKPEFGVSTPDAYRNIKPAEAKFDLKQLENIPVEEWKNVVKNDFEKSVFPGYPKIEILKKKLYEMGALFASMSGSGSAVFGIFRHLPTNIDNYIPQGVFIYP